MLPAYTLDGIRQMLSEAFRTRYASNSTPRVRMVGALFAPAGASITKAEILPRLDDFHHRSGNNIDFFCAGYGAYWPPGWVPDEKAVATTTDSFGNETKWKYSSKFFNDLLNEMKKEAKNWKYSGEVDLLLLNALSESEDEVRLDFTTCVTLAISRLKADKVIGTVPELFEQIFSYAEEAPDLARAERFSDKSGVSVGRTWLVDLVTSHLPLKTGTLWTKGHHYAIVDLT